MDESGDLDGRALVPLERVRRRADEGYVRRRFWDKVRRTLGRVPFMEEAAAAYFCALDPATPARVKAVLLGALAYFIVPTDMIPDIIAGLGFTDDASVILAAISVVSPHIKDRHKEKARRALTATGPDPASADEA